MQALKNGLKHMNKCNHFKKWPFICFPHLALKWNCTGCGIAFLFEGVNREISFTDGIWGF